jgi:rhodanese-related sulfurtransferase
MSINVTPNKEMLENSDMVIVDIRTEGEWMQTGVVPGCKTIMFFDERGGYDAEGFLKAIDALGGKEVEIGLICRTGARTSQVANFMKQQGYNVKNLVGGVMKLMSEGYQLVPYKG